MKTILNINGTLFVAPSASDAARIMDLLARLKPIRREHYFTGSTAGDEIYESGYVLWETDCPAMTTEQLSAGILFPTEEAARDYIEKRHAALAEQNRLKKEGGAQ